MRDRLPRVRRIRVVDSHTEGDPTPLVLEVGPDLGIGTLGYRVQRLRPDYDHYRPPTFTAVHASDLSLSHCETLMNLRRRIRDALKSGVIRGNDAADVDHVELLSASPVAGVYSRNFVLCPGAAFDRSPCGTGTSAKLACLYS